MHDQALVLNLTAQILTAARRIARRFLSVRSVEDWVSSEEGIANLDGICMQLIVVGESVKNLDRVTSGTLLVRYPEVDWKSVKGIRDIISHQYSDLDAAAVFDVCQHDLTTLIATMERIMSELSNPVS